LLERIEFRLKGAKALVKYKTFALDFDGVIADGLNECILVTWNGFYGKNINDFSLEGLAKIPNDFVQRFTQCRNFAKHLGHFAVSIFDLSTPIKTQDDYENLYHSLNSIEVENFVESVNRYRAAVRSEQESLWLDFHTLYPSIQSLLKQVDSSIYIVSAKDSDSILKILARSGINIPSDQIFGEQRQKIMALEEIQRRESVYSNEIFFLDDNIMNVIEVKQEGYSAHWASWGYRASHHLELAKQHEISLTSLDQLPRLMNIKILESTKGAA
jgi:phosphoglycolate phosphatase-like HAD superfamily hydrolase